MRYLSRRGGRALLALAGATLAAWLAWTYAVGWRPATDNYPKQGIDISDAHGVIDWPSVAAAGAEFAYIRATGGAEVRDSRFATNWSGAFAAGLRRGAIHEFNLCRLASDQARNFLVSVPRVADALPAAIVVDHSKDCASEPARDVLTGELRRFIGAVESHTGKTVIVQFPPEIEEKYRLSASFDQPLWSTGNFFVPGYAVRPWRMWRASDFHRIRGVTAPVNWDVVAR